MLFHAVAKPLMFFCAGNVQQHYRTPYLRKVTGAMHTLPFTGGLLLMATFAVTGVPPFGLFQSELITLSAGLAGDHVWPAGFFIAGIVTIFAGFLTHMSRLTLGRPAHDESRGVESPWKLSAMLLVAVPLVVLGLVLPAPLYELVHRAALMIEGAP
jgi:hydrogenase-4 component F